MSTRITPMVGKRFGRLIVLAPAGVSTSRLIRWLCQCNCGTEKIIDGGTLRRGHALSCGCYRNECSRERAKNQGSHKQSHTRAYKSWATMIQRCTNTKNPKYPRYGGRGIRVCQKWLQFAGFFEDMGPCPDGCTIDRKNNDGNYEPGNCRWATQKEQARNKHNNRLVAIHGQNRPVAEWCEILGLSHVMVRMRLHRGWPIERAFA